jgi:hypothetical protein
MAAELRQWRPMAADGGRTPPMAAKFCRWRPSDADGGQVPRMAAECCRWPPGAERQASPADQRAAASAPQVGQVTENQ